MRSLPDSRVVLVVRTDFSDDSAWDAVVAACEAPSPDGFLASLSFVDDPQYAGLGIGEVVAMPGSADRYLVFLADSVTMTDPERPIVAVDLQDEPGRTVRVIPAQMWSIENNVSLSNMPFREFADAAGPDGVYRGFQ